MMYWTLTEALRASGITERYRDPLVDRGDGVMILIRPSDQLPMTLLLSTFIPVLRQLIQSTGQAFRLRIALHAGQVHHDQWGQYGESLDIVCRLLDAPALKDVLANTVAPLALVVSDDTYQSIIRHGY